MPAWWNAALYKAISPPRFAVCDAAAFWPCSVLPTFPRENRLLFGERAVADADQPVRILQALDVARDDVGVLIIDEIFDEIERAHADLIAGRHHLPEVQPAVERGQVHHRKAETAALRDHADAAGLVFVAENRAESRVHARGGIDHALAVRADDADIEFRRDSRELALHRDALAAGLRKTGAEHDRIRHAELAACAQGIREPRTR
jgi:hypothetical protein